MRLEGLVSGRRAWGLHCAGCGDGEDEQPLRRVADGVEVVGLVPEEELIDLVAG
jgi:hypothetical protein